MKLASSKMVSVIMILLVIASCLPLSKEQPVLGCRTDVDCIQLCAPPDIGVCSIEGECECVPGPTKSTTVVQDANSRIA
nr:hypothetical protein CFP56_29478 [Quercus suber]